MTETEILRQIVQKQDELIIIDDNIITVNSSLRYVDSFSTQEIKLENERDFLYEKYRDIKKELAELRHQLEKAQETKLSIPLDVPSKKEIIQSVEYIFKNTKRIHGNSDVIDWQKVAIHKSVEYILSLPLDVPTDEEIENKFPYAVSYANMCSQTGAKWAIEQIIERNQK